MPRLLALLLVIAIGIGAFLWVREIIRRQPVLRFRIMISAALSLAVGGIGLVALQWIPRTEDSPASLIAVVFLGAFSGCLALLSLPSLLAAIFTPSKPAQSD